MSIETLPAPVPGAAGIPLVAKVQPFGFGERLRTLVPEGLTLTQMLDLAQVPEAFRSLVAITLDGDWIPERNWPLVRPKAGALVVVNVVPGKGGGGGGGKNPLRSVLSIAVIAASFYFGGALGSAFGLPTQALFPSLPGVLGRISLASLIGGGIISVLGNLAVNAIAPPPTPKLASLSRTGASNREAPESPTLAITGAQNRANPFGPVPRVYGRHRVFPVYAALPFTENEGDTQFLYLLLDFGYGPLALSDICIGTNPISGFDGVEMEIREGYPDDPPITLFRNSASQDSYSITLRRADGPRTVLTQPECDEIGIDFGFRGLVRYDDSGRRQNQSVQLTIEYREAGSDGPWLGGSGGDGTLATTAMTRIAAPDGARTVDFRTDHAVAEGSLTIRLNIPATYAASTLYAMTVAVHVRSEGASRWVQQYRSADWEPAGSQVTIPVVPGRDRILEVRIEQTNLALVEGTWNGTNDDEAGLLAVPDVVFEYMCWQPNSGSAITCTNNTNQSFTRSVRIKPGSRRKWEVRVGRTTADSDDSRVLDEVSLAAVRSTTYRDPTHYPLPHCLMALRIKATDQLNGVVDSLNAIAHSVLDIREGSQWVKRTTRNPAWIFADILRGGASPRAVSDDRLDIPRLEAWAAACDAPPPRNRLPGGITATVEEPRWTCDLVIDWSTTVWEALSQVAAVGRAAPGMLDGRFSVVRDLPQDSPVQLLTPRNSWGFKGKRSFVDIPHAFRVRYVDPQRNWQQAEVMVYADGHSEDTATRFEELELLGCTRREQAWREGRYHLAVGSHRPETFELNVDVENIVCTRGDLVEVAHDVPRMGGTWARVSAVDGAEGMIATVTLDEPAVVESGKVYALRCRQADGTVISCSLASLPAGEYSTLPLATPTPAAQAPAAGDLAVVGESDRVTARMIVKAIEPGPHLSARLILLDAAPEIHEADSGAIPSWSANLAADPAASPPPPVQGLRIEEENRREPQRYVNDLVLSWSLPAGAFAAAFEIYRQDNGDWRLLDVTPCSVYRDRDLERGRICCYKVLGVTRSGAKIPPSAAPQACRTVQSVLPPDVAFYDITASGTELHHAWSRDSTSLHGWSIRYCPTPDAGLSWAEMTPLRFVAYPTDHLTTPTARGTYAIKAVDFTGYESLGHRLAVVTATAADLNAVQSLVQHSGFPGEKSGLRVTSGHDLPAGCLALIETGKVSDWASVEDLGDISTSSGEVEREGTYDFDSGIDLGAVYTSRLTVTAKVYGRNLLSRIGRWNSITGRAGIIGADATDWNVTVQVRATDDDPAGTPAWNSWQNLVAGDFTARAFQFRAVLKSLDTQVTPVIEELAVEIDMPDRTTAGTDIPSSAAGTTVIFPTAFFSACTPSIAITPSNLTQGDYYQITAKSHAGFTIRFFNSAAQGVSRTFDYLAVGYGQAIG